MSLAFSGGCRSQLLLIKKIPVPECRLSKVLEGKFGRLFAACRTRYELGERKKAFCGLNM